MALVIHPAIDEERLRKVSEAAAGLPVLNAGSESEALQAMPQATAFFGKITPLLLAAASRLRWVQAPTASLEHYLFPELVRHSCILTNMRGLFSDVIAEQVIGYLVCFSRNLHTYIRNQMGGKWAPVGGEEERVSLAGGPGVINAIDRAHGCLGDRTVGIVGLGAIGSEIARRCLAFSMRVLAVDPVQSEAPAGVAALWKPDRLPELLAESDYVVIAAPHTPTTAKMFRRTQFRQMKPSSILVNVGRGVIVDLADLVAALAAGEIAGAALDVFEVEPLPADSPLWRMPNVIITPHVAGYSTRVAARHLQLLLDNVARFVRGEPLRNVVDKNAWF